MLPTSVHFAGIAQDSGTGESPASLGIPLTLQLKLWLLSILSMSSVMSILNLSGLRNKSTVMKVKLKKPDRFYPPIHP